MPTIRAFCSVCNKPFTESLTESRDNYDAAEKKARGRAGSHMWSKHVAYNPTWREMSQAAWDALVQQLRVEASWVEESSGGQPSQREIPPPRSLGGPEPGVAVAQQDFLSQSLQGQRSALAACTVPEPGEEPASAEGAPVEDPTRPRFPKGNPFGIKPVAGVMPPPPARGPPARPNEPGSGSGGPPPRQEPAQRELPQGPPEPQGERGAAAGSHPTGPPPARPPIHRVQQEQPRGRSRSQESLRLLPARESSGVDSYDPSRSPCSSWRERSRPPCPRRRRRAATAPLAPRRGTGSRRGGRSPAPVPPRRDAPGAGSLETEIGVLRHSRAANLPLLLPPFLRSLSTEQLRSTVALVMEEWSRREAT